MAHYADILERVTNTRGRGSAIFCISAVNTSYFTGHAPFAYPHVLRGCSSALFKLRSGKDFIFLFGVPSGRLICQVRKIDQRGHCGVGFIV
jgi:hypothetical protein